MFKVAKPGNVKQAPFEVYTLKGRDGAPETWALCYREEDAVEIAEGLNILQSNQSK